MTLLIEIISILNNNSLMSLRNPIKLQSSEKICKEIFLIY